VLKLDGAEDEGREFDPFQVGPGILGALGDLVEMVVDGIARELGKRAFQGHGEFARRGEGNDF
jgi:hypothetical protein